MLVQVGPPLSSFVRARVQFGKMPKEQRRFQEKTRIDVSLSPWAPEHSPVSPQDRKEHHQGQQLGHIFTNRMLVGVIPGLAESTSAVQCQPGHGKCLIYMASLSQVNTMLSRLVYLRSVFTIILVILIL